MESVCVSRSHGGRPDICHSNEDTQDRWAQGHPKHSDMLRAEDGPHPSSSHPFSRLENV